MQPLNWDDLNKQLYYDLERLRSIEMKKYRVKLKILFGDPGERLKRKLTCFIDGHLWEDDFSPGSKWCKRCLKEL